MFTVHNYFPVARANEAVFRNVLRDLRDKQRPLVPKNLETEAPLEEILQKYSHDAGFGFSITDFSMGWWLGRKAAIDYQNVVPFSGGGIKLKYSVKKDSSVRYKKTITQFRS